MPCRIRRLIDLALAGAQATEGAQPESQIEGCTRSKSRFTP
jgi:hypothetical protein